MYEMHLLIGIEE